VVGRVERFRDELVLEVTDVARASEADADPAAFLPSAYRDLGELDGFLEHLAGARVRALPAAPQAEVRPPSDGRDRARPGRTREFTYGAEFGLTDEGRLLGHVTIGQRMVAERAAAMDEERRLALLHCVLCHHGPEGVPGRRFASVEALALYRLNALESAVKGALEHGLGGPSPGTSGPGGRTADRA
jgi:3'-5' exoribonuclease